MTSKIAAILVTVLLLAGCDLATPLGDALAPADSTAAHDDQTTTAEGDSNDAERTDPGGTDATTSNGGAADGEHDHHSETAVETDKAADTMAAGDSGHDHISGNMIQPDVSDGLPEGHDGSGRRLVSPRNRITRSSTRAVFRQRCEYSHMAFDDPIVHPGEPGASHLHAFFGNTEANANSTASSLAGSGNSTCMGGIVNRTSYWAPVVVDARTHKPVVPKFISAYYREGFGKVDRQSIQAPPNGLRMIAGNHESTGNGRDNPQTAWMCKEKQGPVTKRLANIPSNCEPGKILRMIVKFPQCWDGRNLDSADHKSHMAYSDDGCPSSHPVPLPQLVMYVNYEIRERALDGWRLVSDAYDPSLPGGRSAHADWFNGWDRGVVNTWLDNCYTQPRNCSDGNLNNGTGLDRP